MWFDEESIKGIVDVMVAGVSFKLYFAFVPKHLISVQSNA